MSDRRATRWSTGAAWSPCVYMLPPERRLGPVLELIEGRRYFRLHGGRQTGKTTSARWLVKHYNAGDRVCAI